MHLVRRAAVIFEVAGGRDHVVARLLHRLAGVARLELRQFLRMVGDGERDAAQDASALGRAHPAPGASFGGRPCGGDRLLHIDGVAGGDLGEDPALGRRDHLDGLAGRAGLPTVVDEDALGRRCGELHVHGCALVANRRQNESGSRGFASTNALPPRSRDLSAEMSAAYSGAAINQAKTVLRDPAYVLAMAWARTYGRNAKPRIGPNPPARFGRAPRSRGRHWTTADPSGTPSARYA